MRLTSLVLGGCALLFSGCGGGASLPPMHAVSGVVTKAGAPLANINVSLIPLDENSKAPPLLGISGSDGTFTIKTMTGASGAPVGRYKVVLAGAPVEIDYGKQQGAPKRNTDVPKDYTAAVTSPLTFEVKPEPNVLTVKLP